MIRQNFFIQEMVHEGSTKDEIEQFLKKQFGNEAMKSSTIYKKIGLVI